MGRPIHKKYFGNTNPPTYGIGGEGIASVTLGGTNNSTGFTAGAADVAFAAPTLPGGVQATGSITLFADGILVAGQTTFTAAGTGVDGLGAAAATYTGIEQKSTDGDGEDAVFTIVKANTNGVVDYSDITVTITAGGTGYDIGDEIVIDGADIGGVTVTNDLTLTVVGFVTNGTIQSISVVTAGSGYTSAPTVTLSNGTKGTLTVTAVLLSEKQNAITMTGRIVAGSTVALDVIKQTGSRRYLVTDGTNTGVVTLVGDAVDAAGEANIVATDSAGGTYYVTKLTAHRALVVPGTGTQFPLVGGTAQSVPWVLDTAVLNTSVKIPNA